MAFQVSIMVWHYHDDDVAGPAADIDLSVDGLPLDGRFSIHHYRVDQDHSNSYEVWKKMGSPQPPSPEQYSQLERAGQLEMVGSPEWRTATDGKTQIRFSLPRQGVSLLDLRW